MFVLARSTIAVRASLLRTLAKKSLFPSSPSPVKPSLPWLLVPQRASAQPNPKMGALWSSRTSSTSSDDTKSETTKSDTKNETTTNDFTKNETTTNDFSSAENIEDDAALDDESVAERDARMQRLFREMMVEEMEMEERGDDVNASPAHLESRALQLRRMAEELEHDADAMFAKAHRRLRQRAREMSRRAHAKRDQADEFFARAQLLRESARRRTSRHPSDDDDDDDDPRRFRFETR